MLVRADRLGAGRRRSRSGPGSPTCCAPGWRARTTAGATVAFPAGALLVACSLVALAPLAVLDDRADLDLLDPELRRWIVYVLGVALLGLLDDALGRGAAADTPRGWRGHARARARAAASRPARSRRSGRWRSPPTRPRASAAQGLDYVADLALLLLATNLFNLLDLRPGRAEKAFVAAARRALPRRLDGAAARAARDLHRPGRWSARAFTLRERAMLGDTGSNLVGALAGVCAAGHARRHRRAGSPSAIVAALTIYGEFRSISAAIESRSATALARLARQSESRATLKR